MRVAVSTYLDAPPERIWQEVRTTKLLSHVNHPLVKLDPIDPPTWPEVWEQKDYLAKMILFGFLPFGEQVLGVRFEDLGEGIYRLRDEGHGDVAKVWDHVIYLKPEGEGTHYTDEITVEAGWMTLIVAGFSWVLYHHRQRKWRKLVKRSFEYPS